MYYFVTVFSTQSTKLWVFAVKSEAWMLGSGHRIRNLFEKALKADQAITRRSPLLWKLYLQFELNQLKTSKNNTDHTRNIIYRAVRAVPWSKQIWLEAINSSVAPASIRDTVMNITEVNDLIQLMAEKELRLHVEPPM